MTDSALGAQAGEGEASSWHGGRRGGRQRWEGRAVDWVRNKAGTFDSLTLARDPSYLSIQRISQRDGKEAAIRTREKAELVETEDENEEK